MTELERLVDFHKHGERQGPGSAAQTLKALNLLGVADTRGLNVADIGCGTGAQTMVLAENADCRITAVDLFPEFLERLRDRAMLKARGEGITTLEASMDSLPFDDETFDLIWSEGAVYIMGFEEGIRDWKRYLKPGGYLVVSEISWITPSRPKELEDYWMNAYPQMDSISRKISLLEKHGYSPVAHFILPEYCWTENYYNPILSRIPGYLAEQENSAEVRAFAESEREEIDLYNRYKEYYSYVFYLARKTS